MAVELYLLLLLCMSLVTLAVWGKDKAAAVTGGWRTPEKTLFWLLFLGGAAGGGLGMLLFHHKTHKPAFHLAVWAAGAMQVAGLILLLRAG
jgi:uncharacterized membrane protein YsdA (DUF1294 family)